MDKIRLKEEIDFEIKKNPFLVKLIALCRIINENSTLAAFEKMKTQFADSQCRNE